MRAAPIIVVLAAGGLLGWYYPQLSRSDEAPVPAGSGNSSETAEAAPAPVRIDAARQAQWNAGQIVLPRAGDGHFYADVSVDGVSTQMLVDTGASVIALTADDAANMGYLWDQQDVRAVAHGAGGDVYGVPITLDRVQLGEIEAHGVRAIIVPEGLEISLLGQSFLARVGRVEIDASGMILGS